MFFVIFLITRLYKIGDIPPSVYWDEASIGYNAYSIGVDLKDEWGKFLPIHFRAFGEFKLPVYIYSVVPFVKILGLNATAVRLPAVFYSLGSLILIYLLTKKITDREWVGVLASFIFSVSPWYFIFSRTGYEATAGVFFFLAAIYLFLLASKRNIFSVLGVLAIIASIYSYTSFRIISPIALFAFLIIFYRKSFRKKVIYFILSILLFILSLVPIVRLFIYDAGFSRAEGFALFPSIAQVYDLSGKPHLQIIFNRDAKINWWSNLAQVGKNYLSHFSGSFLITSGDMNPRSQIPGHGELYWIDIPLILMGLYAVIRSKNFLYFLPVAMLIISPIPAALTKESPHALRSILAAPSFAIIASFGTAYLKENLKQFSTLLVILVIAAYYLSFENYGFDFLTKYSVETANDWQYQYKQTFENQKSGVVTDKFGQPYIFALFYQKIPPSEFRSTVKYNPVDKWGQSLVASFDGFQFKSQ